MKPNVFKYHDYRAFLKDVIAFLQLAQPELSMRMIAQKSEFAVGYLPMVLSGKRNLSLASLAKLKKTLKLKTDEVSYLKHMIAFNDSDSREDKLELLKKMQKFQKYSGGNAKELEAYKYLTKWHYVALREMIALDHFKDDPAWIQEQLLFAVSTKEINEGLDFLLKHGFIAKDAGGKFQTKDKMLDCFDGIFRLSLGEFYKQIFGLAVEAIDNVPRNERLLLGHTFAVSDASFAKISRVLEEALSKAREIEMNDANKERIYQVSFNAFPLTKKGA